MFNIIYTL